MTRSQQRRAAVFVCYTADTTGKPISEVLLQQGAREGTVSDFTRELAQGVTGQAQLLDALIESKSQGWSLSRIGPLEKSIMRIAIYEMLNCDDIPYEVSIDEAVELAKEYCEERAPAYVNGVLASVLKEVGDGQHGAGKELS